MHLFVFSHFFAIENISVRRHSGFDFSRSFGAADSRGSVTNLAEVVPTQQISFLAQLWCRRLSGKRYKSCGSRADAADFISRAALVLPTQSEATPELRKSLPLCFFVLYRIRTFFPFTMYIPGAKCLNGASLFCNSATLRPCKS